MKLKLEASSAFITEKNVCHGVTHKRIFRTVFVDVILIMLRVYVAVFLPGSEDLEHINKALPRLPQFRFLHTSNKVSLSVLFCCWHMFQ